NQSIGQHLSVHKDSFSNPPTNRCLEEAVVVDLLLRGIENIKGRRYFNFKNRNKILGNQSIGQYLSVHKDSFSNPPTNRRLEDTVDGDWPKMTTFKAS
ncbi:hypothetical protein AVEN_17234-2-1, partial [Araneus ventricosus]